MRNAEIDDVYLFLLILPNSIESTKQLKHLACQHDEELNSFHKKYKHGFFFDLYSATCVIPDRFNKTEVEQHEFEGGY